MAFVTNMRYEDNLVDLEDYHVDVKHVQLRHSMKIMQERHGGRGKRCFFQILQLKRFKRVERLGDWKV